MNRTWNCSSTCWISRMTEIPHVLSFSYADDELSVPRTALHLVCSPLEAVLQDVMEGESFWCAFGGSSPDGWPA